MTLNEVKELIELVAKKGFAEFEIAHADFKLKIVANVAPSTVLSSPASESTAVVDPIAHAQTMSEETVSARADVPAAGGADSTLHIVKSPIVGTFYRSVSPTADAFVKIGDAVEVGAVLCIIEAMKLMNEIECERAGEIIQVFVENGQPVEFGQPLFGIR